MIIKLIIIIKQSIKIYYLDEILLYIDSDAS